jgi:hypothetical protein
MKRLRIVSHARPLLVAVATLLVAVATLSPPIARADGDPASDVLLGENVFYPYSPGVSTLLEKTLNAETASASRNHFPIKVAVIASPVDLGVIPDLFGKPQQYAAFLDQEISFQTKRPLLVVMSSGYGVEGLSGPARTVVPALAKPISGKSDDLARAAITAVAKLAAADGHPVSGVPGVPGPSRSGGGSSTTIMLAVLLAAALVSGGALLALRRRRAPA